MPLLKNKIVIAALIASIAGIGIAVFVHYPKIIHHYGIGCAKENEHIPGMWMDCCPGLTADPGCRECLSDSWTCKKPAVCGDGVCETEETAATCVTDCGNTVYCGNHGFCEKIVGKTSCRIDYGCGCAEDGERRSTIAGLLECCGKSVPVNDFYCADCGNGTCTPGENKSNCPADCYDDVITCLTEGETYPASSDINKCCGNLTNVRNTCFDSVLSTYWTCTKCGDNICGLGEDKYNCPTDCLVIKNCAIIGDPSEICDCECNNYCIKTGYLGGGSYQNIGTIGRYIEMANGPSCSQGLHENYNQKLVCTCENCEK